MKDKRQKTATIYKSVPRKQLKDNNFFFFHAAEGNKEVQSIRVENQCFTNIYWPIAGEYMQII